MKTLTIIAALLASPALAYELKNLSPQDIMTIGHGLDKLPREETDANRLYARIQQQLRDQDAQAAKDAADKRQAEIDAAVKAKTEPKPSEGEQK